MIAHVRRSPKTLSPKGSVKQSVVSFGALPEEIERWKSAAKKADRPLSWWIRNRLLFLDANEEAIVTGRPLTAEEEARP